MSKMNYKKCERLVEAIVAAYKARTLPASTADHEQLKVWSTDPDTVLQIRHAQIQNDIVAQIIGKIKLHKHIEHADPLLVVNTLKGLYLLNGNHTVRALEQVIRYNFIPGLKEVPILIVPDDMLPSDPDELKNTLRLIGVIMNRQTKIVTAMKKADLRNAMLDDRTDGIDIEDIEYQRVQAKAFDYDLFVVRDTVAKLNLEILTAGKNKKFHFKELTPGELGKLKVSRSTETNFVQIAGVTKDKIFGSFAGIMQALVEHETCDNVHVIFHFKNYDDIRTLKIPTQEKIEKFKKFVTVPVTYEFVDKEQFIKNNGIDVTMFAARG